MCYDTDDKTRVQEVSIKHASERSINRTWALVVLVSVGVIFGTVYKGCGSFYETERAKAGKKGEIIKVCLQQGHDPLHCQDVVGRYGL